MREQRRPSGIEAAVERLARKFDPELTRLDVAAQLIRLVSIVYRANARAQDEGRTGLQDINAANVLYSGVVVVLIEVGNVLALTVHRLRRDQCVREGYAAEPGLANKTVVVAVLFGRAMDLQIDFANGVPPGLAAFGDGQRLAVEHDLLGFLPSCRSER